MSYEKEIDILKEQLKIEMPKFMELQKKNLLAVYLYKNIYVRDKNDKNECKEVDDLCKEVIIEGSREIRNLEETEKIIELNKIIEQSYQIRGRRYFEDFLISVEYEFEYDGKFYEIRKRVLREWVKYLEALEYGELKGLSISAPPRSGKTACGEFFLMWVMLRHPEKSCLFVSHTAAMANKVFKDILNYLGDPRRNIKKIFEEFEIKEQSAEYMYIQLKHHGSNPYHTAYFRGIDGNMAGVLEASWLLYCDDLIKNIEEAMNPDRLENARNKYGIDIRQRKSNKNVRELHIATRWSTGDVISTLEREHEEDEMWKFIKKPALDENGKSNFMYEGDYALDEEYFYAQRNSPMMDEISFSCIYQQEPLDRTGLMFSENGLQYFDGELPEGEPDLICAACDVAWGGGDYLSFPIAKVYGYDVYIYDWIYSKEKKTITKPLILGAIKGQKITKAHFEANNGGDEYAEDIERQLKEDNYRCLVTHSRVPTTRSKLMRIQMCNDEITGISSKYKLYFLSAKARKNKPMYNLAMKHLFMFSQDDKKQGKQKDDVPDSLANLVTNVLDATKVRAEAKSSVSRKELGF